MAIKEVGCDADVTVSAGAASATIGELVFSNSPTVSFGLVTADGTVTVTASAAGGGGGGSLAIGAGTQSVSTGTVSFSNSNGLTFGMAGSHTITASFSTLVFSNSNNVSFGIAGSTLTATATVAATPETPFGVSAGTQSVSTGTVRFSNSNGLAFGMAGSATVTGSYSTAVFSNSNNVSFGTNGSTVTASVTVAATPETPFGISAGTQSVSTGTLVFSNSNGIAFGMAGSSQITASYTQSTGPNAIAVNAAGSITAGTAVFSNSNNITFGLNGSTITASATVAATPAAISVSGSSVSFGTLVFSNSNGLSFGLNGSTVTAQNVRYSYFDNLVKENYLGVAAQSTVANLSLQRVSIPDRINATQLDVLMVFSAAGSTQASLTLSFGIYTMSQSTASLASSATRSVSWVTATTAQTGSVYGAFSGSRWRSVTLIGGTWAVTPGEYMLGVMVSGDGPAGTSAAMSFAGRSGLSVNGSAEGGGAKSQYFADGVYSAATGALINSFQLSDLQQEGANVERQPYFRLIGTF